MGKFSEDTLNNWRMPPSNSEETKLCNAERMVKEAINEDAKLSKKSIQVFGQGSYANDTNIRLNSDIDMNVCCRDGFYYEIAEGKTLADFGLDNQADYNYTFQEIKNDVESALVNKFGRNSVIRNDKCITIQANSTRIETDVVPTFEYRYFFNGGNINKGTKFCSDKGIWIDNYPLQHIENGKSKNLLTQKRFKRLTRIFRRIRYKMIEDGLPVNDNITSFLLECLVWNVPNPIFNNHNTWTDRLTQSIVFLYENTNDEEKCKNWGEVSECLYLFVGRKWTISDVNAYLVQMWNYLEVN